MPPTIAGLSDEDRKILDAWVGDFGRRWEDGLLIRKAGQIPPGSVWRIPALAEMVKIDLERQWHRGHDSRVESYFDRFPELRRADELSADLILAEFEARRRVGSPADLESFLRRFPEHAGEVARRIASGGSSGPQVGPSSIGGRGPSAAPSDVLPAQIGRYKLTKRLGQGGMGSVYLAEDTQLGRKVALKVPRFGPDDGPDARERFFREARTAATLDHPYLCPVYDVGEVDGHLYLTMAFIEGKSLAEALKGEGMPPRQVAAMVGKLAVALHKAHAKGVVHRDLKPANVMIKADGNRREPVIVDFGLALHKDGGDVRMTRTGQVMGTLAYMSPEQVMGDMDAIGPSCDIYALGVILYELLTGRLPFKGAGLAIAGQILTQPPLPPTAIRRDLDPRIEAICLKAMAKKPADRHASMGELASELTEFLKAPATSATESPPPVLATPPEGDTPKTSGGDRLMAEFFQGLSDGDKRISPRIAPGSKKPAVPPSLLELGEAEPGEIAESLLVPKRIASPSRNPPVRTWSAMGAGALAVCLVIAWMAGGFGPRPKEGIVSPAKHAEVAAVRSEPPEPIVKTPIVDRTPPPQPGPIAPAEPAKPEPITLTSFETPETRPTLLAKYKPSSLVLDGAISPGEYGPGVEVNFEEGNPFGVLSNRMTDRSTSKTRDDLSVRIYTAYSDRSLFFGFHVRDQFIDAQESDRDKPQHNDAIELFIDGDRVANDLMRRPVGQPLSSSEGFQLIADTLGNQYTSPADFGNAEWKTKTMRVDGGYVMEFEIPLALIDAADGPEKKPPVPGSIMNLTIAFDDNDAESEKTLSLGMLRTTTGESPFYGGENAWGFGIRLEPPITPAVASPGEGGWKLLFNGKDLDGWRAANAEGWIEDVAPSWTVRDGILHGRGPYSYLFSPLGHYRNFRARIEAKVNNNGNSGLFFHIPAGPFVSAGYEAQIGTGTSSTQTGSLHRFSPEHSEAVERSYISPDTWFMMEVLAVGNTFQTRVDGKPMIKWTDVSGVIRAGHFAIQARGLDTHVQIRKLEVMELDDSGNPAIPATSGSGFRSIFNGKDLIGWKNYGGGKGSAAPRLNAAPRGTWSIQAGHLVAAGSGGQSQSWLIADGDYKDFQLRFEAQISPESDGGVALWWKDGEISPIEVNLRTFSNGTAPTGSVRLTTAFDGSAYWPPDREAEVLLEPLWNVIEVEARGPKLRVKVNHVDVNSLDLSTFDRKPLMLPAVGRESGRLGFQAHTGTIRLRAIDVRPL